MNTAKPPESWERAKRMAFWDQSKLTYPKWRSSFVSEKAAVVRQSINYMRPADLIGMIGEHKFVKLWPKIRELDGLNANKKTILDAAWGLYVADDVSFRVTPAVARFHPKKLATLRILVKLTRSASIYEVAMMAGRDYRRVHDDVMEFVKAGIATIVPENRNGRIAKTPRIFGIHLPFQRGPEPEVSPQSCRAGRS